MKIKKAKRICKEYNVNFNIAIWGMSAVNLISMSKSSFKAMIINIYYYQDTKSIIYNVYHVPSDILDGTEQLIKSHVSFEEAMHTYKYGNWVIMCMGDVKIQVLIG